MFQTSPAISFGERSSYLIVLKVDLKDASNMKKRGGLDEKRGCYAAMQLHVIPFGLQTAGTRAVLLGKVFYRAQNHVEHWVYSMK